MDIHNIDEFLDLQDQTETNLLATEQIEGQAKEKEEEWHSATPLNEMLSSIDNSSNNNNNNISAFLDNANTTDSNNSNSNTNWEFLKNGFDGLPGMNLTEIMGHGGILTSNENHSCITPDSLIKQPEPAHQEKRITRSKSSSSTPQAVVNTKKKRTRAKKLYCICQQPYNGKPMVQCDKCEEWFHCSCVGFDPDNEEDIDWMCKNCMEAQAEKQDEPPKEEEKELEKEVEKVEKEVEKEAEKSTTTARQTRNSARNSLSKCLYEGCNNPTRADSFCSDVCARKQKESTTSVDKPRTTRRTSSMRTSAASVASPTISVDTKKSISISSSPSSSTNINKDGSDDNNNDIKDQPEDTSEDKTEDVIMTDGDEEEDENNTPNTPMSPSQMTEEENPVRRNVIRNMTNVLKTIFDVAIEENPDMFDIEETTISSQERAELLAKSIERTMLEQLGDLNKEGQRQRTCSEPYKSKFRSLLYNLKDKANKVFQLRVVTGDLSPNDLVKMSSEDMANPELKSMSEVLRKKALKNSVMTLDNMPIIKKTHKGDIIMVPKTNNDNEEEDMYSHQVKQELDRVNSTVQQRSSSSSPPPTTKETNKDHISSLSPNVTDTLSSDSKTLDPLDDILARIGIPTHLDDLQNNRGNKRESTTEDLDPELKKRKVTKDVEELLGEEDDTPFMVEEVDTTELNDNEQKEEDPEEHVEEKKEEEKEEEEEKELPVVWHGRVNMPQVAEFEATARQIGGRSLNEQEWQDVLSPTMWIEGRIPTDRVTSYITQTQYSTSREIVIIEVEAKNDGNHKEQEQTLIDYLESRNRYAVVGHNKKIVKDFYLIPLYQTQQIPDCLYVVSVEERKRKSNLFLGVLVITKQQPQPQPQQQQQQDTTNPILPQTTNTHQLQYPSTTVQQNPYYPPSQYYYQQNPYFPQQQQQQQQPQNNSNYPPSSFYRPSY